MKKKRDEQMKTCKEEDTKPEEISKKIVSFNEKEKKKKRKIKVRQKEEFQKGSNKKPSFSKKKCKKKE